MNKLEWASSLFSSIDAKDTSAFLDHLSNDCTFRFGNMPAVNGSQVIEQAVSGFFDSIKGLSHEIVESHSTGDQVICHGMVTYQRHDGSELTVPFANIMKFRPGSSQANEYLIFADTSELYS